MKANFPEIQKDRQNAYDALVESDTEKELGGLFVSNDAGKNWKKLSKTDGLPEGDYGRIGLASCRSYPNRVYALVEATACIDSKMSGCIFK